MRALLTIYRAYFKTWTAVQLQYRVAVLIWLIAIVLDPVIYLVVWSTIARAQGGSVGGYEVADFAAYFIISMVVTHLTFTWHMWEYDYRIRQGLLSPMLLRPVHPIHNDLADNITYKAMTLVVMVPTAIGLALVFHPALNPPLWAVLAFFPALVLAFFVRFLVGWLVAMAAFWTTRVIAVNQTYYTAMFFFSGQIAPLALLPGPMQALATLLPFRWMIAFPVELLMGRLTPGEALTGLVMQAAWLALSLVALRFVWRAGVRRYSAVGA